MISFGGIVKAAVGIAAAAAVTAAVVGTGGLAAGGLIVASGGGLTLGAKLAVGVALTYAAGRLAPKPKMPKMPDLNRRPFDSSFRGRMLSIRQPVTPREMVYGAVRKGGTIIFLDSSKSSGSKTFDKLNLVIAVATHQVNKIGNIYLNGELAVTANDNNGSNTRFGNKVKVGRHLGGTSGGQPFPLLNASRPSLWTVNHVLKGVAAIHLELTYDPDLFPSGIPNITADIEGKNDILDPRTGNRGYTNNAALCLADYLTDKIYGVGMDLGTDDGLNTQSVIDSTNVSGQVVTNPNGSTSRRYTMNGVVDLSLDKKSLVESMLTSMVGDLVYDGGQFRLHAGYYRTPVATITEDDVISAGLSMATRVSRSENANGIRGQFVSPENDWQPDDFPAYQSNVYLTEDNNQESWQDISLPFTTSAYTAQRLAKVTLEKLRRQISVSATLKLQAWKAQVGDNIFLTYPRWGFTEKPFYVKAQSLRLENNSLVVDIELQETSPLVFDSNASEFQIYDAAPRTNLPNAFVVQPPTSLEFNEELYVTRQNSVVKNRLTITWQPGETTGVDRYQIERKATSGDWVRLGESSIEEFIIDDAQSGNFQWRVRAINALGVRSEWFTSTYTISGLLSAPSALSGLQIQQAGGIAILSWDRSADLDVSYGGKILIRHSSMTNPLWANGVFVDQVSGSTNIAAVPLLPGTYMIRAEDSSGQLGPFIPISTDGIQSVEFANINSLVAEPTWSGTKTDVIVGVDDRLKIDSSGEVDSWTDWDAIINIDNEGGILPEGTYEFATTLDFSLVKAVRLRRITELSNEYLLDTIDGRLANIDTWLLFDGPDGNETNVRVEARTTKDDPSGSPTWSDWFKIDNTEVEARGVQGRVLLTTKDPNFNVSLSSLQIIADEVA